MSETALPMADLESYFSAYSPREEDEKRKSGEEWPSLRRAREGRLFSQINHVSNTSSSIQDAGCRAHSHARHAVPQVGDAATALFRVLTFASLAAVSSTAFCMQLSPSFRSSGSTSGVRAWPSPLMFSKTQTGR